MTGDSDFFANFSPRSTSVKERFIIAATFVALIAGIVVFATLQYRRIIGGAETLLSSVSIQKAEQISQWRLRHIIEANETGQTGEVIDLIDALMDGDGEKAKASLRSWFGNFRRNYGYSGSLALRPDLTVALSSPEALEIDDAILRYFDQATENGQAAMTDLYYISSLGGPGCAIIIPIFADHGSGARLTSYIVHFLDAESELFPMVQSWSIPNETAENLIIRRDPGQVTILSNLKFIENAALAFSLPSDAKPTVETLAAKGARGFIKGKNYRYRKVQAVAREVEGTDWILLSEIENNEITKPWWGIFLLLAIILVVGMFAAILSGTVLLQRRSSNHFRKLLESERRLRATESKFSVFMDHMPSMVLIKDNQSRILFVNKELLQHFAAEDWAGKSPEEILPPERSVVTRSWDQKAFSQGYVEYEETREDRNGQTMYLLTQKFTIQQNGNPPLLGQIMTDLTERNRTLRQIRELNLTLEEKVRERTAQLEASNAELQSFTYSVSHDLRGPLRSLDGFAELLAKNYSGVLDEQGLHYVSRISNASIRMAGLINDLLSLSKISNVTMKKERVDIGGIANSIISDYIRKEPDRIVSISIKPSMVAFCDAYLVGILLRNLIDNAFKFSKGRARTIIELGTTRENPAHRGLTAYYLKDNGVGFDMTYAGTLFQPFHRLHDVQEFPGNGIGLAIAKRIVDRHGGALWLESEAGKGTTASFILNPE